MLAARIESPVTLPSLTSLPPSHVRMYVRTFSPPRRQLYFAAASLVSFLPSFPPPILRISLSLSLFLLDCFFVPPSLSALCLFPYCVPFAFVFSFFHYVRSLRIRFKVTRAGCSGAPIDRCFETCWNLVRDLDDNCKYTSIEVNVRSLYFVSKLFLSFFFYLDRDACSLFLPSPTRTHRAYTVCN